MELGNGSRIISLPGSEKTVRGYSGATLIVMDEASRVPDELLAAVRPMLATTNGKFIALSTPAGKRGWFYESWTNGEGWERISVKGVDCPRISAEFLAEERVAHGPMRFAQEYECEFIDPETSAFSSDLIAKALTNDFEPFFTHNRGPHVATSHAELSRLVFANDTRSGRTLDNRRTPRQSALSASLRRRARNRFFRSGISPNSRWEPPTRTLSLTSSVCSTNPRFAASLNWLSTLPAWGARYSTCSGLRAYRPSGSTSQAGRQSITKVLFGTSPRVT